MALIVSLPKPLSVSPLKISAPLGGALAFMGLDGCLPLFHGAQGCTAFALVALVRHFREAIPLQTTAMDEITTILGGMDNVEQALLNITRRANPKVIGLLSTALTETRGEDMEGDLRVILGRNSELAGVAVVPATTPDYDGSLETGWSKAVEAMIRWLPQGPQVPQAEQVNILPGSHLTPGDIEELRAIVEDFGLEPVILPDLSGALDGHLPSGWVSTTLGGTSLERVGRMARSPLTIAIGEHMRGPAEVLRWRTGVPVLVLDRIIGLDPVDRLMVALANVSGRPVPLRYQRQRSQLIDAMLDGQFAFAGRRIALAGEPDLLWSMGRLVSEMGARVVAATTTAAAPFLAEFPAERVIVGDLDDLDEQITEAGGCDLLIANSNATQLAARRGLALFRVGFPVFDRLGVAQRASAGYRGTRDLIFTLAGALADAGSHLVTEHRHEHAQATAG